MSENHGRTLWDALGLPIDAFVTEVPDDVWNAIVTHATAPSATLASLELLPPDDSGGAMPPDLDLEQGLGVDGIVELGDDADLSDDADLAYSPTGDAESAAHSTMAGASDVADIAVDDHVVEDLEDDPTGETFAAPEIEHHHDGARGDQW